MFFDVCKRNVLIILRRKKINYRVPVFFEDENFVMHALRGRVVKIVNFLEFNDVYLIGCKVSIFYNSKNVYAFISILRVVLSRLQKLSNISHRVPPVHKYKITVQTRPHLLVWLLTVLILSATVGAALDTTTLVTLEVQSPGGNNSVSLVQVRSRIFIFITMNSSISGTGLVYYH